MIDQKYFEYCGTFVNRDFLLQCPHECWHRDLILFPECEIDFPQVVLTASLQMFSHSPSCAKW